MNTAMDNTNTPTTTTTTIIAKPKRKKLVGIGQVQLKWLRFRCLGK